MKLDLKKMFGSGKMEKKPLSVAIGIGKSDGEGDYSESDTDESDERLLAAKSIIRAIKDNDPEALDVALADHYDSCKMSEDE